MARTRQTANRDRGKGEMMKKYVLVGGTQRSIFTGDCYFVDSHTMMKTLGLQESECILIDALRYGNFEEVAKLMHLYNDSSKYTIIYHRDCLSDWINGSEPNKYSSETQLDEYELFEELLDDYPDLSEKCGSILKLKRDFIKKLESQKEIDPYVISLINDNFWDLLA